MCRLFAILAALMYFTPLTAAPPPITPAAKTKKQTFDGKVMPLADALKKLGMKPEEASGVAIITSAGQLYILVKDDTSQLLFLDKQLHHREIRLTAKLLPGSQKLKIEKVQIIKEGKLFEVDYWCENCQLAYQGVRTMNR